MAESQTGKDVPTPEVEAEEKAGEGEVEKNDYKVRYENPCCVVIEAEASAEELKKEYEEQFETYRENASLPGFRRGKAPRLMVERRFGDSIKQQVLYSAANDLYSDAIKEEDFMVVNELDMPDFEDFEWEPGKPASFEFKCEIIPSIDLDKEQYKGIEIEVPSEEIPDEFFESALESFAQRFSEWEKLSDESGIDREDSVQAALKVKKPELKTELSEKEFHFQPARSEVGPFVVEGLQGAVEGAKIGDTIEVDATVSEHIPDSEKYPALEELLEADNVVIELGISDAYRQKVPEIDDQMASRLGLENAEEIRDMVRSQVEKDIEQQRNRVMRTRVLDRLAEQFDMDLPDSLIKQTAEEGRSRAAREAWQNGQDLEEAKESVREDDTFEEEAEKMLKIEILLREIADKERVYVSESEIDEQIRTIATGRGMDPERTRRMLEKNDMLDSLRRDMRKEKVIDLLLENAELNEVEWNRDQ